MGTARGRFFRDARPRFPEPASRKGKTPVRPRIATGKALHSGGMQAKRAQPEQRCILSNTDSFIDEVSEELRRDRITRLMKRYGWLAVVLVVAVVGGAAWYEWQRASERARAEAFGDAILAALETPTDAERRAALRGIEADGAQQGLLNLLIAAEALRDDRDAALAALAAAADDSALPQGYRQLAALKRIMLGGDTIDADERETVLSGLAQPGQAFRPLALEQLALLRLELGEGDAALAILRDLLDEPDVTESLRRRVTQLIVALGGEIDAA